MNGNGRSWHHAQCGRAVRADREAYVKVKSMSPSAAPATPTAAATTASTRNQARQEPAQCHKCHACRAKCTSMSPSATPTMQSKDRCRQVPRLPRQQPRRQRRQLGTKRATRPRTTLTHSTLPKPHARRTSNTNFRVSACHGYPE